MTSKKYMVEVRTRFKCLKNLHIYKISTKVLTCISILLMGGLLVFTIKYSLNRPILYCKTDKCIRSAAYLKLSMNMNANPCQNFYEFTCGKWSKNHPLLPGVSKTSKFTDTAQRINMAAQTFLSAENEINDILPVNQSRIFYRSCLDKRSWEALGFTTIYEYLNKMNLPIIPSLFNITNDNYTFNWLRCEANLKKIFRTDVFLSLYVWPNRFNISERLMYIGEPTKMCPNNRGKKEVKELNQQILKYIVKQIMLNASSEIPSEESLDDAVGIIENIGDYLCRKPKKTTTSPAPYHRSYKFQELQDEIDIYMYKEINRTEPQLLQTYIGFIFDGIKKVIIDFQHDYLFITRSTNKTYIMDILTFVYKTPQQHVEFYMWWLVVIRMARYTHLSRFIEHKQQPHRRIMSASGRSRELICARSVSWYMNYAVAYGIVDKKFRTTTGQKVRLMVEQVREELRENIRNTDWLDDETRAANLEKLDYMTSFIGVPDWFFEKHGLEQYYRHIDINPTNYLRNQLQINELSTIKYYETLRDKGANNINLPKDPLIVNAFNMFQKNAIVFPLGILTFPMYDFGLDVLNYGVIGTIIGHELIHGFDSRGIHYDKYGNYRQWWSEKTESIFMEKTQCLVQQYDNLTIGRVKGHVSGWNTRNENIADNGGLNIAFKAFKKNEKSVLEKLPGFENFTTDQMFFIAAGNVWCDTRTYKQQENALKNDIHSPVSFRVNVVMQNSVHFAKVFNCPKNSHMNPEKKCKIW